MHVLYSLYDYHITIYTVRHLPPPASFSRPSSSSMRHNSPTARYRDTSLIRNTPLLGPYSRTIPRIIRWS